MTHSHQLNRRQLLKAGGLFSLLSLTTPVIAQFSQQSERRLSLYNLHTEESLSLVYWKNGEYLPSALAEIDNLLRDHRSGEQMEIDRHLLDLMALLYESVKGKQPYHIISGFRSEKTNTMLRSKSKSSGVAQKSYHMLGKAIDLRLPGIALKTLQQTAIALAVGGVGYYPKSDFIHIDTGPVRQW